MNTANVLASLTPEMIALLQTAYAKPAEEVVSKIVVRNAPAPKAPKGAKPSKLAEVKASQAEPVKREAVPATFLPIELPPVGTYDAATFLAKSRSLGPVFMGDARDGLPEMMTERNGWSFVQRRDEAMKLIAGFVGFDRFSPFGEQWDNAHRQANLTLRPLPPVQPRASITLRGYISGIPSATAKKLADLQGRARLSGETIATLVAIGKGEATPEMIAHVAASYETTPEMIVATHTALLQAERNLLANLTAQIEAML